MTSISDETNIDKIEHKSKKNIALGTIFGYLSIFVSVASGLILTPWIIDNIGRAEYGLYGLATSVISLFLLDFGLTATTNTYLAKLRAKGDKDGVQRFLSAIFKLYLTLDAVFIVVIGALYFLAPVIYKHSYNALQIQTLQYLLLIVGGYSLVSFPSTCFSGVISTYEKFSFNKIADLIQKVTYLGLTIAAIQLNWGVIGITAVNAASGILAVIIRFVYMRLYLNIKLDLKLKVSRSELKSIFIFSAWSLVYAICARLVFNVTPSILGIVSNSTEVAIFSVVATIEGYIYMFGAMTSSFFLAKVARTENGGTPEEKRERLQALGEKIGKVQFVVIALIFLGFVSVGQEFVTFWMNGDKTFQNVYWCILALCAYEVLSIPQIAFNSAMYTEGHVKPLAINAICKAVINLALSFLLSSFYGAFGAAIAIMAARWISFILDNIAYKRYLKLSLSHYYKKIFIRGGITIIISLGVGLLCHFFMPIGLEHIKIKFLVNGIIFVITYVLCTYFITFTKDERTYYFEVVRRLLHLKKKAAAVEAPKQEENKSTEEVIENKEEDGKQED